jgi:hypothetical protein
LNTTSFRRLDSRLRGIFVCIDKSPATLTRCDVAGSLYPRSMKYNNGRNVVTARFRGRSVSIFHLFCGCSEAPLEHLLRESVSWVRFRQITSQGDG